MTTWTFAGYWNAVLGTLSAEQVVEDYGLETADRVGLSEWLGHAEAEAWAAGKQGGKVPAEWAAFHEHALDALARAEVSS